MTITTSQEYRTLQRKKLEDRPYLDNAVIRESEHFYSLKGDEGSASSSSSSIGEKPVKNPQQTIKELQVRKKENKGRKRGK